MNTLTDSVDLYGTHNQTLSDPELVGVDTRQDQSQKSTMIESTVIPIQFSLYDSYLRLNRIVRLESQGI